MDVKLVFLVVYKGVNCSNWDGAIKQWGKITTKIKEKQYSTLIERESS